MDTIVTFKNTTDLWLQYMETYLKMVEVSNFKSNSDR